MWRTMQMVAATAAVLLFVNSANASVMLSGTVQFDDNTDLYTYKYTVNNDTAGTIWNLDILVGNTALGTYNGEIPIVPHNAGPSGWSMSGVNSGSIGGSPYNEAGGFYQWYAGNGSSEIQPGSNGIVFTVITSFAPTWDDGLNDYFLYGSAGIAAFGNIVVPDGADWIQAPSAAPIPGTLPLLISGLGTLGIFSRRKKRKVQD
jgi:hypothetical protein